MKRFAKSKAKRILNKRVQRTSAAGVPKPRHETEEGDDDVDDEEILAEEAELQRLVQQRQAQAPPPGSQSSCRPHELLFSSLPISKRTLDGLSDAKFTTCTAIQAAALPHALAERDILGAAKTGSGKTLAFVIPIIERLYVERWAPGDGLAACIITPTRELALQIFDVLRLIGKKHEFSAGMVTGGRKDFVGEQSRIGRMNILVATPGRLLQHLEQTSVLDCSQLMMLVLDEADRILDMGFKQQLDSILEYLPNNRQTLLFSATQTKSVKDLARLSLCNPEYLAVHADDQEVTPSQLVQNYIVCPLHEKLDLLFSFIKAHVKSKLIVFFSTCAQVRFVNEVFCAMQPGIPIAALHGKIKQERRTAIFLDFTRRQAACLLCTDIAARGLDFPRVDWVIQADAPEDKAMYIHRVGRTARYTAAGRALMLLIPHEEVDVTNLLAASGTTQSNNIGTSKSIPLKKLTVNPNKRFSVSAKAAALLAAQPEIRALAKRAFTSYLRSLQLLPGGRAINDIAAMLPVDEFATSLGLAFAPDIPVLSIKRSSGSDDVEIARQEVREKKNVNRSLDKLRKQIKLAKEEKRKARESAIAEKNKSQHLLTDTSTATAAVRNSNDDDDELFLVNRSKESLRDVGGGIDAAVSGKKVEVLHKISKTGEVVLKIKGGTAMDKTSAQKQQANKLLFDEDGNTRSGRLELRCNLDTDTSTTYARAATHAAIVKSRIDLTRREDDQREKERLREKRKQHKDKLAAKKAKTGDVEDQPMAILGDASDSEDHESDGMPAPLEADESETELQLRASRVGQTKRKAAEKLSSDESDSSSDSDYAADGVKRHRPNSADLRKQEQTVLQMLA